jgi:hypothetical protein
MAEGALTTPALALSQPGSRAFFLQRIFPAFIESKYSRYTVHTTETFAGDTSLHKAQRKKQPH